MLFRSILPGDSVSLFRSGYFFSVTHFDDGDNIIVVWPQAITTPVLVDTLQQQIHFVSLLAGIDNSDRESLILYPNPASKFISFNIPDGLIIKQVRIYDAEGREIYQSSFIKNYISINEWPAGIYLIEVEKADGNKQTLKLLKE